MSGNLDRSLDEIMNTSRARRQQRRRDTRSTKAKAAAPVGGVRKSTRQPKPVSKVHPTPATGSGESKIIVSGLPADVNEASIKDYFHQSAGPVKKVMVTYNQNGTSRGIAAITFSRPDTAAKAAKELNGLLIDKRPIKIEVVVDASRAPPVPPVKPLGERVAQPKSQPKPASAAKSARDSRARARRGRNANRPKPKTAADLDAEMQDYFDQAAATDGGAANGTAQPANEDTGMDEIS